MVMVSINMQTDFATLPEQYASDLIFVRIEAMAQPAEN